MPAGYKVKPSDTTKAVTHAPLHGIMNARTLPFTTPQLEHRIGNAALAVQSQHTSQYCQLALPCCGKHADHHAGCHPSGDQQFVVLALLSCLADSGKTQPLLGCITSIDAIASYSRPWDIKQAAGLIMECSAQSHVRIRHHHHNATPVAFPAILNTAAAAHCSCNARRPCHVTWCGGGGS